MRWLCRVDLQKEEQSLLKGDAQKDKEPVCVDVAINDENAGLTIAKLHHRCKADMVVSRVIHPDGTEEVAEGSTMLRNNDIVRILTDRAHLQQLETLGTTSVFTRIPRGNTETLVSRRIVVTKSQWNGQKIGKVDIRAHYHVTITRVIRAGIYLLATPSLTLQLGDRLIAVGAEDDVKRVADLFGNELKRLDVPHLVPVFLGIALGVLVGLCPVVLPGLEQSFRLGLAGGTLVVALLMGRFGPVYKVVTFVTTSANRMLREVGLSLFLAAVGLNAGGSFLQAVAQGGYWWILYGLLITMLPLLIVGWVAYRLMHIDFFSVAGLFTGTMSDAPALAYAMSLSSGNDNASITYATVYPLTMFLRILAAQLIILLLC
jgi:putative transport protein